MSEILFRGKIVDTGMWVYGYYCKHEKRQLCPMGNDELKNDEVQHLIIWDSFADWNMPKNLECVDVIPKTVGQYTNFTNTSNQKIFFGDIIEDESKNYRGIILKINGCWMIEWEDGLLHYVYEYLDCKIIGNMWDNPELLEELV